MLEFLTLHPFSYVTKRYVSHVRVTHDLVRLHRVLYPCLVFVDGFLACIRAN